MKSEIFIDIILKYSSLSSPSSFNLFILLILTLTNHVLAASASGAASSVLSRSGSKNSKPDTINRDSNNFYEDWIYDSNSPQNNQKQKPGVVLPDEQILISKLLRNYDPAARPVYNASKPVVIKFGFALIQICDMVAYFIHFIYRNHSIIALVL